MESLLPNPGKPIAERGKYCALISKDFLLSPAWKSVPWSGVIFSMLGKALSRKLRARFRAAKILWKFRAGEGECPGKLEAATRYTNSPQKSPLPLVSLLGLLYMSAGQGDTILTRFKCFRWSICRLLKHVPIFFQRLHFPSNPLHRKKSFSIFPSPAGMSRHLPNSLCAE